MGGLPHRNLLRRSDHFNSLGSQTTVGSVAFWPCLVETLANASERPQGKSTSKLAPRK